MEKKKMLLHSCCGPCSSHVLNVLKEQYDLTLFYYNPNIEPREEYEKREKTQRDLLSFDDYAGIKYLAGEYENEKFREAAKGLESEPEGGARCEKCFVLRLFETAKMAEENGFDLFATTLSVSPHKNAALLNKIGSEIMAGKFLPGDYKKKNGYLESIKLSEKYGLYRQDYCGCLFSKEK